MKSHGEIKRVDGKRVASPEYRSWQMMKNRCLNPKARDYPYYGGRGIKLCKRWLQFENFLEDMGRRPDATYTLERRNGDKDYTPKNCCWATRETQARNREYAATKEWELADKLQVSRATTRHYLWVLRKLVRGTPTRYKLSETTINIIKTHMGDRL